jgi:hypothetical protein
MPILNKDTSEERRTGEHTGSTGLDRNPAGRRLLPEAGEFTRHFATRFRDARYFHSGSEWEDYEPAYLYGYESFTRHRGRDFADVEPELAQGWNSTRGASRLGWSEARHAVRDGWILLERGRPGDADHDGR